MRRARRPGGRSGGFSLVEAMVAAGLLMAVLGATFQMLAPSQGIFRAQPEVADVHQRLRAGLDALAADLRNAGAGPMAGDLVGVFPLVLPPVAPMAGRAGVRSAGGGRSDAISIVFAPPAGAEATLDTAVAAGTTTLTLTGSRCTPPARGACGFGPGDRVLVAGEEGGLDLVTIARVRSGASRLVLERGVARGFAAGASVVEVEERAYWLDADAPAPTLVRALADGPALPVVDHVVGLRFDYFSAAGPVPVSALSDGPWLPAPSAPLRYDADLLRLRRVRVTLRVEAASPAFRGPAGPLFTRAGTASSNESLVPDRELRLDVRVRNGGLP